MFVIIQWVLKIKYTHTHNRAHYMLHWLHTHTQRKKTPREANILPYHVHAHKHTLESRSWAQEMALWAKYTKAELRWRYIDIRMSEYIAHTLFLRPLPLPALPPTALPPLTQVLACVGERRAAWVNVVVCVRQRHKTATKKWNEKRIFFEKKAEVKQSYPKLSDLICNIFVQGKLKTF